MEQLATLDAVGHAELVASGEASPTELVEAAISRIEAGNPALNAVIIPLFERGLAAASEAAAGLPFGGVPFLLKDALCHSAGDPYHYGTRALKDAGHVATADTYLAARFKASGLALLGKTNTPELAAAAVTEPLAYGPTANPWRSRPDPGWLQRRLGRGGCCRVGAGGPRQRHDGVGANPRFGVWGRGTQADPGPHHPRPRVRRVRLAVHQRVRPDPVRPRRRRFARRDRRPGAGRPVPGAAAAPAVLGGPRGVGRQASRRAGRSPSRARTGWRTPRRSRP